MFVVLATSKAEILETIEARALSLFLPETQLLYPICKHSCVAVPKLLLHNEQEHVLVLSDLGRLPNLSDMFGALGGHVPQASLVPISVTEATSQKPLSCYTVIGERLGSFFARLHSSAWVAQILDSPNRGQNFLVNPEIKHVIHQFSIKPIRARLDSFPDILDATRAKVLYGRIEDDFLRQTPDDELVLALGDCWTGAVLVGMDENSPIVGVIDWEFACLGRGVNGDISQLLGHLHLYKIVAEWRQDEVLLQRIKTLINSIADTYRAHSIQEGSKWIPPPAARLNNFQATVTRSAFLAHGSEMISSAFWKVWVCDDKACGEPHPTETTKCRLVQHMVKMAVWYLDRAGADEKEFADMAQQEDIRDGSILIPLLHCS